MMGKLRDELDIGNRFVEDKPVNTRHILCDKLKQWLEALRRVASLSDRDDNTQFYFLSLLVRVLLGLASRGNTKDTLPSAHKKLRNEVIGMRELMRTNDPVLLSYVEALLDAVDIDVAVLDVNMSVLEGSLGILPKRAMVADQHLVSAIKVLRDAGLDQWLSDDARR